MTDKGKEGKREMANKRVLTMKVTRPEAQDIMTNRMAWERARFNLLQLLLILTIGATGIMVGSSIEGVASVVTVVIIAGLFLWGLYDVTMWQRRNGRVEVKRQIETGGIKVDKLPGGESAAQIFDN